jgi:thiamine biosynthesis lipoprotein
MKRRRFLMIAAAMVAAGRAHATVTTWRAVALGGIVRVDLRGPRSLSEQVSADIARVIEEVEFTASLFRADSAISKLNAAGRLVEPPQALVDLLALADQLYRLTDGTFDATVQPLWRVLAEGGDVGAARMFIGWDRVRLGPAVTLGPGQALTLNGIAQGYAADRVRALLRDAGYDHALVDMGEFAALGGPFRLGLEDPDIGLFATRALDGTAIATSSPAAMRIGNDFHILGPHGGRPLWSTISVEADSAALADGLSTAFCLMPETAIRSLRRSLPDVRQVTAVDLNGNVSTF